MKLYNYDLKAYVTVSINAKNREEADVIFEKATLKFTADINDGRGPMEQPIDFDGGASVDQEDDE